MAVFCPQKLTLILNDKLILKNHLKDAGQKKSCRRHSWRNW